VLVSRCPLSNVSTPETLPQAKREPVKHTVVRQSRRVSNNRVDIDNTSLVAMAMACDCGEGESEQ